MKKELLNLLRTKEFKSVLVIGSSNHIKEIKEMNLPLVDSIESKADIIIEGGLTQQEIALLNQKEAFKISLNIPAGINPKSGLVEGEAFKTNVVLVLEHTIGLYLNDALDYYDEIIGEKRILPRKRNSNKGSYGKACLLGGSLDYSGAPYLATSALGAFKMGLGYMTLGIPRCLLEAFILKTPEILLIPFETDGNHILYNEKDYERILKNDVIGIGMGMGVGKDTYEGVSFLLTNFLGTLVIDADALNSFAKYGLEVLLNKKSKVILTPHIKEFSRLSGESVESIQKDPISLAMKFAKKYQVILVLKSNTTIITDGNEYYINTTGNSGLAKGGSGDMLTGIITGFSAKREDNLLEAVYQASYILGRASELALDENNEFTMLPSDIIKKLPFALDELVK